MKSYSESDFAIIRLRNLIKDITSQEAAQESVFPEVGKICVNGSNKSARKLDNLWH